MKQESLKEKRERERKEWIKNNFGNEDSFLEQVFEFRKEKPRIIRSKLQIPSNLWGSDKPIREFRRDAVKYKTKQRLKKNPNVTLNGLWDQWKLWKIQNWIKLSEMRPYSGYDVIYDEAKKELAEHSS
jgi:hypothetical protein